MKGQKEAGYSYFVVRRFLPDGHRDKSFGENGIFPTNSPGSQSPAPAAVTRCRGDLSPRKPGHETGDLEPPVSAS
jgi:hypothetical protein